MKHVYGLIDPRDKRIKYVGQSDDPRRRLGEHVSTTETTPKGAWIQELRSLGMQPDYVLLNACDDAETNYLENWWIVLGRRQGWHLTNSTNPGEWRVKDDFSQIFSESLREMHHQYIELMDQSNTIRDAVRKEQAKWIRRIWMAIYILIGVANLANMIYAISDTVRDVNQTPDSMMTRIMIALFWLFVYPTLYCSWISGDTRIKEGKSWIDQLGNDLVVNAGMMVLSVSVTVAGVISIVGLIKTYM